MMGFNWDWHIKQGGQEQWWGAGNNMFWTLGALTIAKVLGTVGAETRTAILPMAGLVTKAPVL